MELRECQGYYGKCYHSEDMMVPVEMFSINRSSKDGLHQSCKRCNVEQHKLADPKSNAISKKAYKMAGGKNEYFQLPREKRLELRKMVKDGWTDMYPKPGANVIPLKKPEPTFDNAVEYVETVTKGRKRDQKVVDAIRAQYDECSVIGCDYPLYDVAHIHALKHGSDDLPGNCIPLCPNHHRDLDRGRLLLADPADRSATDPIEFLMNGEGGSIILNEDHDVDSKYIEGCIEEIDEYLRGQEGY